MTVPATTWRLTLPRAVDGDTVSGVLTRDVWLAAGFAATVYSAVQLDSGTPMPAPQSLRLITLDTPERGDHPGYETAKAQCATWLAAHPDLRVDTYDSGGWDRLLGDVYPAGQRSNTLTQFLMRDCGWPAWQPA